MGENTSKHIRTKHIRTRHALFFRKKTPRRTPADTPKEQVTGLASGPPRRSISGGRAAGRRAGGSPQDETAGGGRAGGEVSAADGKRACAKRMSRVVRPMEQTKERADSCIATYVPREDRCGVIATKSSRITKFDTSTSNWHDM